MNEDKASRYHRLKRRSVVFNVIGHAAVLIALLATGWSIRLRDASGAIAGAGPSAPLTIATYAVFLFALQAAVALPLAWHDGFLLEHRFGLSTESLGDFVRDQMKGLALGTVLTVVAAEIVFGAMAWWPRGWWLAAAALFAFGMVVIAGLAPIVLLPLFYRFKPLDRQDLYDRLCALSIRAGVRVLGVYEWGLGAKSRRANAALVGSWRTRRVLVSDTLLAEYSDDEIEVILAHELGHHAHRDLPKVLAFEAVLITAALAVAAVSLTIGWQTLNLASPADVAGAPLLVLAGGVVMLGATPLANALSRHHERRADRYALRLTERPAAFVSALRRLGTQNLAEANPPRIALWLFHSHPPIDERISAARAFKKPARPRAPLPASQP